MKRFVSLCLVMVMLLSIGATQIFAAAPDVQSAEESAALEIQPRAQLVGVPDYRYILVTYDGTYIYTTPVYKELRVLAGFKIVDYGPRTTLTVYNGTYEGIRYQRVILQEWSYDLVPI